MLDATSKVDTILDAWLQFIRLEDLSNAKVPLKDAKCSDIWLTGNTLKVEKELFSKIKRANSSQSSEQQDKTWVLSFPQVNKVEKGKSMLCPLFSLDVTAIFKGDYYTEGWNIEAFEMAEAGENLAAFLNLDEEQIEKLVTKNGLRRFLETTFGFDFENLEEWMQRVSLPSYNITSKPYLFEFKGSGFSFNLKKDLKAIRETQIRPWLELGHPAYEYLFGSPKPPTHETSYLGAFLTKDPPTDSQLKAIKHAQSEPLTAVQGPPGSGKTTLILHLIAQQVVNRTLSLIEREEDTNNLTVVSSTNNRAVENVIERLKEDLPDSFFYLNGGKKEIINQVGGAKEQLQKALDYLQKTNFDENRHRSIATQILEIKQSFANKERNHQEMQRRRLKDKDQQPKITQELQLLQQQISEKHEIKDNLEKQETTLASYDQLPESVYRKIRSQFNIAELEIPEKAPPKWIRWAYWLFGKTERQILAKMVLRCQPIIEQTIGNPFEIEFPLDRSALHQQRQRIDTGLNQLQELRTIRTNLRKQTEELSNTNQACVEKQLELTAIEERLAIPLDDDYYCKFHMHYHEQHKELFNLSRQYLAEEALRRKVDIEATLKLYLGVLSGTEEDRNRITGSLHAHLKNISLIFPVITSTLQSIRNMLPWTQQCADQVIVDESGMIPIHQTFPLLVRTRKAIVVGDPLQLEPIVNQSQQTLERYYQEAFIQRGLTQESYYCYSPAEIGTATTYHRAAGTTGAYGDLGQGVQLLEHYRCQPYIIDFCDRIAKYGLICKTPPRESLLGANLLAYHVDGNISSKVNRDEIKTIHEVIRHLLRYGYTLEDIGVISAFRAQADALRDSLSKEFPQLKNKNAIGTVHTFQGSERRVIILSTKVCRREDSVDWINRRPNLLNVAVSRAQELFILVGNLHRLEEAGSYTRQLVEHIRERGVILEYKAKTEFTPEDCLSSSASWIYDCDHLEILEKALREAKEELYVVVPEIRGQAAQKFNQDVEAALKRGISVTVIYGSNKRSNEDKEEPLDEKELKDLFNKHKCARIFHLKGQGTNERILICDTKFAVVGSWNWLSHVYHPACQKQQVTEEVQITRETSLQISETRIIESKKEEIAELIEKLT
jgi:KaiC/GvpD/RAD55 family RecA-like ATPase